MFRTKVTLAMSKKLSRQQVEQYQQQGFLSGIHAMTESAAKDHRIRLERMENNLGSRGLQRPVSEYLRSNAHYICRQAEELAKMPEVLDIVASILGPDLLIWSCEFFIKEASTPHIVSWHQDLTYWGLGETDGEITAWIALSAATVESGCMRFVPGSHLQNIVDHHDTFGDDNLLSRGQEIAVEVDESSAFDVVLQPGEMSLHHGKMFHASGPNRSNDRRIGCAIRYLRPDVKQIVAKRDYAMLARGWDLEHNFIPVAGPTEDFDTAALARYEQILADQNQALSEGAKQELKRS